VSVPPENRNADLVGYLKEIEKDLNQKLREREEVVRSLVLALLSGEHLYLVGPPGTGKSLLVRLAARKLPGLVYFERLLHQDSDRDSLTRSPLRREGIADGSIVFLDEILRAPKSLLLTLLSFMNERIWHDPDPRPVPLISLFAASNAHPSHADNLEAFFDRFALRCLVEPVRSYDSFVDLLEEKSEVRSLSGGEREQEKEKNVRGEEVAGEEEGTGFTVGDFQRLQRFTHQEIPLSRGVSERLWELRNRLGREGVNLSDRRWKMVVRVLKAVAVYGEEKSVIPSHIAGLLPVLWTYPPEIRTIRRILSEMA